jgi:hypothetical protein
MPGRPGCSLNGLGTKLEKDRLDRFLADISSDYADFRKLLEKYDKGANDFTIFRERPLFRLGDSFYPLDFGFLAAKSESAFFWRAHNSLPPAQRDDFHAFWGGVFERYMHRLITKACDPSVNRYYESPCYTDGDRGEACDGIVLCKGHIAVIMEFKGSVFTAESKYGGDLLKLQTEIEKKLIGQPDHDRKGVHQLAHSISCLFGKSARRTLRNVDLSAGRGPHFSSLLLPVRLKRSATPARFRRDAGRRVREANG